MREDRRVGQQIPRLLLGSSWKRRHYVCCFRAGFPFIQSLLMFWCSRLHTELSSVQLFCKLFYTRVDLVVSQEFVLASMLSLPFCDNFVSGCELKSASQFCSSFSLVGFLQFDFILFRKHLYAGSGATDAHLKHEKVQRQRSDCQPISAISPNLDTYDPYDPSTPSIVSTPSFISDLYASIPLNDCRERNFVFCNLIKRKFAVREHASFCVEIKQVQLYKRKCTEIFCLVSSRSSAAFLFSHQKEEVVTQADGFVFWTYHHGGKQCTANASLETDEKHKRLMTRKWKCLDADQSHSDTEVRISVQTKGAHDSSLGIGSVALEHLHDFRITCTLSKCQQHQEDVSFVCCC